MWQLQDRLREVLHHGNLTVADLARWFDRPDPTVRGWVSGTQVGGAALDAAQIEAALKKLEAAIRHKRGFPVPHLSAKRRIAYLNRLKIKT